MKKTVLVTGGAGFIGSHTVVSLAENCFFPVIIDNLSNSTSTAIAGISGIIGDNFAFYEGDVRDKDFVTQLFQKYNFQGVIHFAAFKAVGESVEQPLKYYNNNIGGLVNILSAIEEFETPAFVFSSSCTVYGEPEGIKEVAETTPLQLPTSPYGMTKWMGEHIISDTVKANRKMKAANLRYFNPIGAHPSAKIGELPFGRPNNLLPFITQTAIGKYNKITVFGNDYQTVDGTCVRDYIHVMDLASAHVKTLEFLLQAERGTMEFINIGTGSGTSVLELIKTFESENGLTLPWEFGPRREGDVVEIFANTTKSRKLLNWTPDYTIADAVKHAWTWEKRLAELNK